MVDLVKIRRKARERKEREEAERSEHATPAPEPTAGVPAVEEPPASPAAAAKPRKSKRKTAAAAGARPKSETPEPGSSRTDLPAAATEPAGTETAPREQVSADARERVEEFRRNAGRRREIETLEQSTDEEVDGQRLEVLVFEISRERYAVEIDQIREITPARAFTRVPNADLSVIGIISLRGTIVTILDVRSRLGHREAPPATDETRIIVVEQRSEIAGFVVDRVQRVLAIDKGSIEANPVVNAGEHSRYIRGVFRYNERITILLDLERLLEQQAD